MISNKTIINQPSLYFVHQINNEKTVDIWDELHKGLWKHFNFENHLFNILLAPDKKHKQKALFPNYLQVEPGVKFNNHSKKLELDIYKPNFINTDFDNFLEISEIFFKSLHAKRIGIHLSGGLDSSIIISILKYLKIPFVPIGITSSRYEFRTEKIIQEELLTWGEDGHLIDYEECPFYSGLIEFPKHQIPSQIFNSYKSSSLLAKAFKEKGCDVVITGQGGDSLFIGAIKNINDVGFILGDEFINHEEADLIYSPLGIKLISFYAHTHVIDFIVSARNGQRMDPLKWWARKWMKSLLLPKLSNFPYYADFMGLSMSGLSNAFSIIKDLLNEAYDLTGNVNFSPSNVNKFLSQDIFSFEMKDNIKFCSLLSIAVWLNSLMKDE